jgi:hypothetical protein
MKNKIFNNCTTHFFITVVRTKTDSFSKNNALYTFSKRCWGYTDSFDKAEKSVLENYTDFHECSYQWAVIEEHVMDAFAVPTGNRKWYHWDEKKRCYKKCKEPQWAKGLSAWGIG